MDSGDDEGRQDRIADTIEEDDDEQEAVVDQVVRIYPSDLGRMAEPEPGTGDVSRAMAPIYFWKLISAALCFESSALSRSEA